jgi:sortase A
MKVRISRKLTQGTLRWTERVFFAGAALLLGYCGFIVADAWIFQQRESRDLERVLEYHGHTQVHGVPAIVSKGLIGRLEIPRRGLSAILIEGDDSKTLRRAIGHIPGTPLPGQPGNVALTGHRDTFFRPLRNILANDIIVVTTLQGEYRYRVVSTRVVTPDNIAVLNSSGGEILTLVTCYPFYYVGAAPDRFIVRAIRLAPKGSRHDM